VDDGTETAKVVEKRHPDTVDIDASVRRRRAPHDDRARSRRRASDAGHVLDDLEHVAAGTRDARALFGVHRGRDDGLVEDGVDDDDFEIDGALSRLLRRLRLDVVNGVVFLTRRDRLFGADGREPGA
jgi:hypothetical protein